jgi:LuxR family maltose regulon positive regulatory protein
LDYHSSIKKKVGDHVNGEMLHLLTYTDKLLATFPQSVPVEKPMQVLTLESLSERELEILQLIVKGCTNQEIADLLVIALSTVKSHINHLYGKLGTQRRTQAISIARDLGLLEERNV